MTQRDERAALFGGGLRAYSSIDDDVWHADREAGAYEWWYFDAVAANGRDVLVVIFLSGFLFSPRYNRDVADFWRREQTNNSSPQSPLARDYPAVAICLYRDGRPLIRSIMEYPAEDFTASPDHPSCRIGNNNFKFSRGANGDRVYHLSLDQALRGGRVLRGELRWEIEAGDLAPPDEAGKDGAAAHDWNLVAPRCAVSGSYRLCGAGGVEEFDFSGTGYHDHNRDRRWIPEVVAEWQWGRAHFPGTTAVFYRFRERGQSEAATRIFLARGDSLISHAADYAPARWRRNVFGLRYPESITFSAINRSITFRVTQRRSLDSSFFYLRFNGEATLAVGGRDEVLRAPLISEHFVPRPLRWRALQWLINMRIGKKDRPSFLP